MDNIFIQLVFEITNPFGEITEADSLIPVLARYTAFFSTIQSSLIGKDSWNSIVFHSSYYISFDFLQNYLPCSDWWRMFTNLNQLLHDSTHRHETFPRHTTTTIWVWTASQNSVHSRYTVFLFCKRENGLVVIEHLHWPSQNSFCILDQRD